MRLPTRPSVVAIATLAGATFASCSQLEPMRTESTGDAVGEREVVFPEQGWAAAERQEFYYLSQGSRLVPYDWFLALEQADDTELFRSDSHLERFGYIVSEPDPRWNPDGLPIGFVRDGSPDRDGVSWLGLTCSACHTTFLEHSDVALRIDAGPAIVGRSICPLWPKSSAV